MGRVSNRLCNNVCNTNTKGLTRRVTMKAIAYLIVVTVFVVSMFTVAGRINAWEKANDYPYGMLCDVYNNC